MDRREGIITFGIEDTFVAIFIDSFRVKFCVLSRYPCFLISSSMGFVVIMEGIMDSSMNITPKTTIKERSIEKSFFEV